MVMGYAGAGSLVQLIRIVQLCKILLSTGARIYWCLGDALFWCKTLTSTLVQWWKTVCNVVWCNGAMVQWCKTML